MHTDASLGDDPQDQPDVASVVTASLRALLAHGDKVTVRVRNRIAVIATTRQIRIRPCSAPAPLARFAARGRRMHWYVQNAK
jgi:hypothetical protein